MITDKFPLPWRVIDEPDATNQTGVASAGANNPDVIYSSGPMHQQAKELMQFIVTSVNGYSGLVASNNAAKERDDNATTKQI